MKLPQVLEELTTLHQWVGFKLIQQPDKARPKKLPIDPHTGKAAKANDPMTWGTYQEAAAAAEYYHLDGIGFEFTGGYCGIDLDHVVAPDGAIHPDAAAIVTALDSYTEYSPSGTGLHVICRAPGMENIPRNRAELTDGAEVEMYNTGRYFTVTGKVYGPAKPIADRTEQVKELHRKYLYRPEQDHRKQDQTRPLTVGTPSQESDRELFGKMLSSVNGAEIKALWAGDVSAYGDDHSRADQALCNHLAYWTNNDADRMDRLFRQSGLMREKWDRNAGQGQTYGQRTIDRAIAGTATWTPLRKESRPLEWDAILSEPGDRPAPGQEPPQDGKGGNYTVETSNTDMDIAEGWREYQRQQAAQATDQQGANPETENTQPSEPATQKLDKATVKRIHDYYQTACIGNHIEAFVNGIAEGANTPCISTGYPRLDKALDGGFYEGLYILGGGTSEGKTTLCLQIMDQIAEQGNDVLIISLEMARTELMAKSISRHTARELIMAGAKTNNAKTARGITDSRRYENYSAAEMKLINEAIRSYESYASDHLFVVEGIGDIGVRQVREYVELHKAARGKAPTVFIDYLQILAPYNDRATDKQNTDKNVLELKRISRDFKIPILAVSSLNRAGYNDAISMESFKESGAIEYSADVLMGLQFRNAGIKGFSKWTEKKKNPRDMMIGILKQRNGAPAATIGYKYYTLFNFFRETNEVIKEHD